MKRINLIVILSLFISSVIYAQSYTAEIESSVMKWTAQKVTGKHHGTINLKSGKFAIENNKITKSDFLIDMNSIKNTDLENADYNAKLVGHLKSDDFFGVQSFPTASFSMNGSSPISGGNATVTGDLTIKGITHPITFKAVLHGTDDGMKIYGNIVVDRTKYDVKYGSGKFFDGLADNTIYDEFTITLDILARKR